MFAGRTKRQKEMNRQQQQQEKRADRAERKKLKAERPANADGGIDPDIAGIIPGPQPLPEY